MADFSTPLQAMGQGGQPGQQGDLLTRLMQFRQLSASQQVLNQRRLNQRFEVGMTLATQIKDPALKARVMNQTLRDMGMNIEVSQDHLDEGLGVFRQLEEWQKEEKFDEMQALVGMARDANIFTTPASMAQAAEFEAEVAAQQQERTAGAITDVTSPTLTRGRAQVDQALERNQRMLGSMEQREGPAFEELETERDRLLQVQGGFDAVHRQRSEENRSLARLLRDPQSAEVARDVLKRRLAAHPELMTTEERKKRLELERDAKAFELLSGPSDWTVEDTRFLKAHQAFTQNEDLKGLIKAGIRSQKAKLQATHERLALTAPQSLSAYRNYLSTMDELALAQRTHMQESMTQQLTGLGLSTESASQAAEQLSALYEGPITNERVFLAAEEISDALDLKDLTPTQQQAIFEAQVAVAAQSQEVLGRQIVAATQMQQTVQAERQRLQGLAPSAERDAALDALEQIQASLQVAGPETLKQRQDLVQRVLRLAVDKRRLSRATTPEEQAFFTGQNQLAEQVVRNQLTALAERQDQQQIHDRSLTDAIRQLTVQQQRIKAARTQLQQRIRENETYLRSPEAMALDELTGLTGPFLDMLPGRAKVRGLQAQGVPIDLSNAAIKKAVDEQDKQARELRVGRAARLALLAREADPKLSADQAATVGLRMVQQEMLTAMRETFGPGVSPGGHGVDVGTVRGEMAKLAKAEADLSKERLQIDEKQQQLFDRIIKRAASIIGEQVGGISITQDEMGASSIQIGGTIKDPQALGREILASLEVTKLVGAPANVVRALEDLANRLIARGPAPEAGAPVQPPAAAPQATPSQQGSAAEDIRDILGLGGGR